MQIDIVLNVIYEKNNRMLESILEIDPGLCNLSFIHNGQSLLHVASEIGNDEAVEILLHFGSNANHKDHDGETPLHVAAYYPLPIAVKLLIEHGADVNSKTFLGKTPLMEASQAASLNVVKQLIDAGCDVSARDSEGRTALHWAILGGEPQILSVIRSLVVNGARFSDKNHNGQSVIDYINLLERYDILKEI